MGERKGGKNHKSGKTNTKQQKQWFFCSRWASASRQRQRRRLVCLQRIRQCTESHADLPLILFPFEASAAPPRAASGRNEEEDDDEEFMDEDEDGESEDDGEEMEEEDDEDDPVRSFALLVQ